MFSFNFKNKKGFTIIEMIIALFVVTVGLLSVYGLSANIISDIQLSNSRATAVYLAEEGLEIVKNIRDTNYLTSEGWTGDGWKGGLSAGTYEADYNYQLPLTAYFDQGNLLKKDDNGFYNYTTGTDTKFKRKIIINDLPDTNTLGVLVEVLWNQKGKPYNVSVQETIYNWYGSQ